MTGHPTYDAVVVGAGPNGLAAAVELARNGCSVAVVEAQSTIGGGSRSAELTLTGSLRAPRHPIALATAGLRSLLAARGRAERLFVGEKARGLFAGNAAHSFLPLGKPPSALFGFLLGTLGHAFGWPFPKSGSQKLADALASYLVSLGGEVYTGIQVEDVQQVPRTRAVLFDVTRAPEGKHTVWAYCHVPNGSTFDMTERIEAQIECFAPGFRDRILALGPAVLTLEYKINYLRPASGETLVVQASVVNAGRRRSVCRCEVFTTGAGRKGYARLRRALASPCRLRGRRNERRASTGLRARRRTAARTGVRRPRTRQLSQSRALRALPTLRQEHRPLRPATGPNSELTPSVSVFPLRARVLDFRTALR